VLRRIHAIGSAFDSKLSRKELSTMKSLSKKLTLLMLVGLALAALTASSAAATPVHWSQCRRVTSGGAYDSASCKEAGTTNAYNWEQLAAGVKKSLSTSGGLATFKGKIGGAKVEGHCSKEAGTGSLENPTGGAAGRGSLEAQLTGCTFLKAPGGGCVISAGTIPISASAELVQEGAYQELRLTPAAGSNFGELKTEKCENETLNQSLPVSGTLAAIVSAKSTLEITAATSASLTMGGNPATIEASLGEEIEGSEPLGAWYGCQKQTAGKYTSSTCGTEGSGGYEWAELPVGKKTNVVMSQSTNFFLNAKLAGVHWELDCQKQNDTGSVENRAGSPAVGSMTFRLSSCSFIRSPGKGCQGSVGEFSTNTELVTSQGVNYYEFHPTGSPLFELLLTSCEFTALNGHYPVAGSFKGTVAAIQFPAIEIFTSQEPYELEMGGSPFWMVGELRQELEGGGYLRPSAGLIGISAS
jgi:hypothetical protein